MTIFEKVKEVRKQLKLTQHDFAEKLSVTQSAISLIEKGVNTPGYELLQRMVSRLNANPWFLLGDDTRAIDASRGLVPENRQALNKSIKTIETALLSLRDINKNR